jgi:hypothetical protein
MEGLRKTLLGYLTSRDSNPGRCANHLSTAFSGTVFFTVYEIVRGCLLFWRLLGIAAVTSPEYTLHPRCVIATRSQCNYIGD